MGQRGEESERETKRQEIKRKMKRIGVKDVRGLLNEGQSLNTFCAQFVFLFTQCCIYPWRQSLIPPTLICRDGWFELRHFSLFFFYEFFNAAVFKQSSSD